MKEHDRLRLNDIFFAGPNRSCFAVILVCRMRRYSGIRPTFSSSVFFPAPVQKGQRLHNLWVLVVQKHLLVLFSDCQKNTFFVDQKAIFCSKKRLHILLSSCTKPSQFFLLAGSSPKYLLISVQDNKQNNHSLFSGFHRHSARSSPSFPRPHTKDRDSR